MLCLGPIRCSLIEVHLIDGLGIILLCNLGYNILRDKYLIDCYVKLGHNVQVT